MLASGIYANPGSAGEPSGPSGISPDLAPRSVVCTMNLTNRGAEWDYGLEELPPAVEKLLFSPVGRQKMAAVSGGGA